MKGKELNALAEDIEKNGLLEPITLHKKKILDGRNRYLACKKTGVKPKFRRLPEGMNPYDFVLAENLKRRHMNAAQLAELALNMLPYEEERAKNNI